VLLHGGHATPGHDTVPGGTLEHHDCEAKPVHAKREEGRSSSPDGAELRRAAVEEDRPSRAPYLDDRGCGRHSEDGQVKAEAEAKA
jgi:hypothetical protein